MAINDTQYRYYDRLVCLIKLVLADGKFHCQQGTKSCHFVMTEILDVEFWNLRWKVLNHDNILTDNSMFINGKLQKIPMQYSRQIAEISSEYAVMNKLGL